LEFWSETAVAHGLDALPGYTPPALSEWDAEHPLALVAPASHWFLNTIFANKPDLMQRAGEPVITLHPDDAVMRGLTDGDQARVFNARGEFLAKVEVADRVRPGVVASTKGHWLKHVRGGANINATVEERDSDMGGGAIYHDNRVEVQHHQSGDQARGEALGGAEAVGLRAG